jgi:endonuclease/exonuclease/phosphatase family metal-dependent hydrolase
MKIFIILKKYSYKIVLTLNIGLAFLLLLSYLSAFVSPVDFYPLAFIGLIYPVLLFLNLIFAIFWITRKSKIFLISTLCILLGWSYLSRFIQITIFDKNTRPELQKVKVLSYNVRIFNLWQWSDEKNRANKIYNFIRKSNSNIVCLQEFYSKDEKGKNAKDSLLNKSSLKNSYISYTIRNKKETNYGIAIFTSFPIIYKGNLQINEKDNCCIYTDLKIKEDTIRVYNIHLESIHLGNEDYYLIDNFEKQDSIDVKGIKNIYSKFKKGYIKRAMQVKMVAKHISKCKYPVILCGDFNDTPFSYVYQQLTNNLDDAFRLSGNGIGNTFINRYRTFRIDYILHSPNLVSFDFKVQHIKYSDHYPVQCYFGINSLKK